MSREAQEVVKIKTKKVGVAEAEERRKKEIRREERKKNKKPKKERKMEVQKVTEEWEIWDKEKEVAKLEVEAKKLVPERFHK